ncbi:MAG TPA: hypothetical protein VFX85_00985 [Solirubrobacterales bacterium]|nr:hypothetical protein [Solirubrobacterales bacterium]
MPELVFVPPPGGADRDADLAAALAAEVGAQDAAALVATAAPERRPDRVCVLLGAACEGEGALPAEDLPRTIAVLSAAPESERFAAAAELAGRAGAAFHVNSEAIAPLHALGVPARHLQLGYAESWAETLGPAPSPAPEVLRDRAGYFDWVAALRALHRGAVVVHEEALGVAPLVPDRHLFLAAPDRLEALAANLAGEPERLERVRAAALEFLRAALPMALAAAALIGSARMLVAQPLPAAAGSIPGQPAPSSK